MVSLRSSTRQQRGDVGSSRSANARASSSSSAKGALHLQSDENAPLRRQALGDIKNVAASRQLETRPSGPARRPLSDRNTLLQSQKAQIKGQSRLPPASNTTKRAATPRTASTRPRRHGSDQDTENKTASVTATELSAAKATQQGSRAEAQVVSHVEVPTVPRLLESSSEDPLTAQIEAAERRTRQAEPSHAELSRLSPVLDSDDMEYFDAGAWRRQHTAVVAPEDDRRKPTSKDGSSEAGTATAHGSSDKENLPPPAARRGGSGTCTRPAARARAGVLRAVDEAQPVHSTPIAQAALARGGRRVLDDLFRVDSDASSQPDSPGVARRAPLSAAQQQLLEYHDHGVSKVMAWKAAGHDPAARRRGSGSEAGSVGSWPSDSDGRVAQEEGGEDDEFGFLEAERRVRERLAHGSDEVEAEEGGLEMWVDVPTDPFSTSDDRRLAEQAFAGLSSPPPGSVGLHTPVRAQEQDASDAQRTRGTVEEEEGESVRRSKRGRKNRSAPEAAEEARTPRRTSRRVEPVASSGESSPARSKASKGKLRMDDYLALLPPRKRGVRAQAQKQKKKRTTRAKAKPQEQQEEEEEVRSEVGSSPVRSSDSDRTRAVKNLRAADSYALQVELVL